MKSILIIASILLLLSSGSSYAEDIESTNPSASSKIANTMELLEKRQETIAVKTAESAATRLENGIQRGVKEIDRRIDSLKRLIDKINSIKKLSTASKNTFVTQIQTEIDSLTTLKTKIQSDTDLETLKIDLQSVVKNYRTYGLYLPKMRIFIAADRLGVTVDNLSNYSNNLSSKITEKEASGEDMTDANSLLSEINSLITSAKDKYNQAISLVTPLLPEGYPDNKETLKEAQDVIKSGAKDLKAAFLKTIELRKLLGEKPKGSFSPSNL